MYKLIKNPDEGTLVQYLGMYVTRWQPHMGEPTVGFVEVECEWVYDSDDFYNTKCGESFMFSDGTPKTNGMAYCPFCGGTID